MGLTIPHYKKHVRKPETTQASDGIGIQRRRPGAIKELRIGIWNVLTLYKGKAMSNLDKVLQEYRVAQIKVA
jgi:hypothetical protein